MAPPPRKTYPKKAKRNHKFVVKVHVPKASTRRNDFDSYQKWMKKKEREKKSKRGRNLDLSHFPPDLVENILEGLSSADRIRFGATCKKNLSFVTTTKHHHRYEFRTIDKLPWLATFHCFGVHLSNRRFVFRLFEPLHHRGRPHYAAYEIRDPKEEGLGNLNNTSIKASKKGWFLCLWPKESPSSSENEDDDDGFTSFLLFSPFNKRIIKLPDLDHNFNHKNSWMDKLTCRATFSSDPSSPDCVYFFLSRDSGTPGKIRISTLHQSSPNWETKEFDELIGHVSSVAYHDGCFYCLSSGGQLAAYDVVQQSWELIIPPIPLSNLDPWDELYLVVCEGKLLFTFVDTPPYEYNVGMIRCGLFEFSSTTRTWVEKTSLGNHALFLGKRTSLSVPIPSWSDVAERVYFYSFRMDKDHPLYYSFKDGRCHPSKDGGYRSSDVNSGMWIEPPSPS